jgi:dGTPase
MRDHGGFEHNLQSLRVVDLLETRYPQFDGLNLTFEAREGVLKHCSKRDAEIIEAGEPGGVAHRFVQGGNPSLEARLVNLADEMAYNAHDIDDGVRSGLITLDQAAEIALVAQYRGQAIDAHPPLATMPGRRLLFDTMGRMLSAQVCDVVQASGAELSRHRPADAQAARQIDGLIRFGDGMRTASAQLKRFLFGALYRHPQVARTTDAAKQVVRELFAAYMRAPREMPDDFVARDDRPRAVADYIAGMTDRFAAREHLRLTGREAFAPVSGV